LTTCLLVLTKYTNVYFVEIRAARAAWRAKKYIKIIGQLLGFL